MGETSKRRVESIDVAKGLGILVVIFGHILGENDLFLEKLIFSFHMPLFFVLSGFVLKFSGEKGIKDYLKQESKLIAAYIFYSLLYIVVNNPISMIFEHEDGLTILSKVYHILVFYGRGPIWFLPALVISHIFCKILRGYFKESFSLVISGLFLLMVLQVLNAVAASLLKDGLLSIIYYPLATVIRGGGYTFFVILGVVFKDYYIKLDQNIHNACKKEFVVSVVMIAMLFFNILGVLFYSNVKTLADPRETEEILLIPIMVILAITGSISALGLSVLIVRVKFLNKFFVYMGQHSLFIMATHLQFYICAVARRLDILGINNLMIRFIFVVVAEIILIKLFSVPFDKVIEYIRKYIDTSSIKSENNI